MAVNHWVGGSSPSRGVSILQESPKSSPLYNEYAQSYTPKQGIIFTLIGKLDLSNMTFRILSEKKAQSDDRACKKSLVCSLRLFLF